MSGKRKPYMCGEEAGEQPSPDFLAHVSKMLGFADMREKIQSGRLADGLLLLMLGIAAIIAVVLWL